MNLTPLLVGIAALGTGLLVAGVAAAASRKRLLMGPMTAQQRLDFIKREAKRLRIEPAVLRAIIQVEAGGKGFSASGPDGQPRMIIRFERHIFERKQTKHKAPSVVRNQDGEYKALAAARSLDDTAALQSISMGAGQVMGFNSKRVGYPSVQAMFEELSGSEEAQLLAMVRFIETSATLLKAARTKAWTTFAVGYNGPAQQGYDKKMASAYAAAPAELRGLA